MSFGSGFPAISRNDFCVAVAVSKVRGPAAALAMIEPLAARTDDSGTSHVGPGTDRAHGGGRQAMRVLFARHHVRMYRFVLRIVRDETLAEDMIGEMFLDVCLFYARKRPAECSRARAWIKPPR